MLSELRENDEMDSSPQVDNFYVIDKSRVFLKSTERHVRQSFFI